MQLNEQISAIDSPWFGKSFTDPEMRRIFSSYRYIEHCIDVEVALAKAQARLGLIPTSAAEGIENSVEVAGLNFERLQHETDIVGYPILPLVEQLSAMCGDAGRYLHWGATTQDIMDTAIILQVREGLALIDARLSSLKATLGRLAKEHRDTVMAGRTHLQHALPITFGYKAAVWLSSLERHIERLEQLRERVLIGQFSGAAGTLASLGESGLEVQEALMKELELKTPSITWHSARDTVTEVVQFLAMVNGSLAKIACDVSIMMMTEIGEVSEPFVRHRGASSTMPQKQNPVACELILASAKVVRQHAGLMLDAMVHDFERATGPWHLEWFAIPESFGLTSGSLSQSVHMLDGLVVDKANMKRNLDMSKGLIVSESVMMALAPEIGRKPAHDLVYLACRKSIETGQPLLEILIKMPEVTDTLTTERLTWLLDPANYVGTAPQMVDRMVASHE
ncbi:class-II fumarase/aspartase family protein [Billgrantia endophytica]|uniref:3-carboxy-cis,cis-muconate cycloisomerase n=1 Tax=Billgrantia endophytica TaxID=2033802 RepID=A0A2N7U0S2_9GAMM|nr:adenylosuccinate lyase family protein [Halomonas endophytica]PMR74029.1 3-carboxy-cis,cis-muconate cycloisomerase [Halomonas endophytica]